jgi:hypothetical protein
MVRSILPRYRVLEKINCAIITDRPERQFKDPARRESAMTPASTTEHSSPTPTGKPQRSPWLDPRRFRFWAVVSVVLYTLGGFFLAPWVVGKLAVDGVRDTMDRELELGEVRVNPYVLSLDIDGIALRDADGETLLGLDHFRANFQLSSLFRWAWTFREIRFDGPYVLYERFAPGDDRFTRLAADMARLDTEPEPPAAEPGGLPRLLIHDLQVNEGRADVRDHVPRQTVQLSPGPVTVEIHQLNTLPDGEGRQSVDIRFAGDASATWQGSLELSPLQSEGRLELRNMSLDPALHYLDGIVDLAAFSARLSLRTDYRVAEGPGGDLSVALSGLESDLEDLAVSGFEPAERILELAALRTRGGRLAWPEARLDIGELAFSGLEADLQLDETGQPRLLQLLPPTSEDTPEAGNGDDAPWQITADALRVEQARIALQDRSVTPAADLVVAALDLALTGIDNRAGTAMPLSVSAELDGGGRLGLEGNLVALPETTFEGSATLAEVPLALGQSYVQQAARVLVEGGALGAEFALSLSGAGDLAASGAAHIDDLALSDTVENQPLLAWKRLSIDRFEADTATARAELSRVALLQPFGRIQVRADRSTNLSELVVEDTAAGDAEPEPAPADAARWRIVVGLIDFESGGMDFSDLSLPLPFNTRITDLGGAVTTIDSTSTESAGIRLEGKVGEYGLARIDGEVRVFDPLANTDITMEFRNLLMSDLSPYSVEFAGRRIDEGKLGLDLEYVIENSRLAGRNDIVVSDLVLGEKVDSPNAVSLPLDLAVALLRDSEGVIDIELPVEGDVGDPEFRIGGVIWKAFTGLITRIVTAPFALLGSLVGSDADDFGQFEFLAGRADLTPPEVEKIGQLAEALQQRPQLALTIGGVYDAAVDTPMLQFFKLRAAAFERLGRDPTEDSGANANEMLAAEFRDALEDLHRERFPDVDLETVRAAHRSAPADDPEGKPQLDELAYGADLRDRLLAAEPVSEDELRALAQARAATVREAFLATGTLGEGRLRPDEPAAVESDDEEWVVMELAVATE